MLHGLLTKNRTEFKFIYLLPSSPITRHGYRGVFSAGAGGGLTAGNVSAGGGLTDRLGGIHIDFRYGETLAIPSAGRLHADAGTRYAAVLVQFTQNITAVVLRRL